MAAMATYVRAGLPEVAAALAALTGEPHPLAIAPSGAEGTERERRANGASEEQGRDQNKTRKQGSRSLRAWPWPKRHAHCRK